MEQNKGKILIIDDDDDVLISVKLLLKKYGHQVIIEPNPNKIPFLLNNDSYDAILLDMNFSKDTTTGKEGFFWLEKIREKDPSAVVILITAYGDIDTAVEALKCGATDFIQKPWQNEKLLATINSAVKLSSSVREINTLKDAKRQLEADLNQPFKEIIGDSEPIKEVFKMVDKVANTEANILILGENGTGKELIARAIHERSSRKYSGFISVDMGAISPTLFESELFGHVKGAFTDAMENRIGRLELANKGTVFLDEIGNLNPNQQAKILSVLQNRNITKLGSNRSESIDVRVISATNLPIHEMVETGDFRQDLLFRINTVVIQLPPLRDRLADIPQLTNHFSEMYCQKYRKSLMKIEKDAIDLLQLYPWPGNVRELQHAVERAVIMSDKRKLSAVDFEFLNQSIQTNGGSKITSLNLNEIEKNTIKKALQLNSGNMSKAADDLGITRTSLYRRLQKHGI